MLENERCRTNADPTSATRLVAILALAAFVNMMGALALGPFLPVVANDLGTSVALLGQVPSLMMLLAALLGLAIGPLADRYGFRWTLVIGLLTVAIGALGTALTTSFPPLLLAGLIGAVGRAAVMPTAQAVVGAHFSDDDRRRRAISWISTGHTSSALLGIPLLTGVAAFAHWRGSFFVLGGLALAMALLLWRMRNLDIPPARSARGLATIAAAYAPLRRHRPTLALIGQNLMSVTGTWVTFTYFGAYLAHQHGSTTQEVGVAYLAVGAGVVLGTRLVGSRLGARPRPLLSISRVAGGLLIGAGLMLPLPVLAAVGLLVLGAMATSVNSAATAVVLIAESPAGRATTMTFNNASSSLGVALGGALGGLTLAIGDYWALGLVSLTWLLTAAAMGGWSRPERAPAPAPAAP